MTLTLDGRRTLLSGKDGTLGTLDNLRIVSAVPEPSSLALLGWGAVVGLVRRRKTKRFLAPLPRALFEVFKIGENWVYALAE